jgi:hypothetical protein
MAHGTRPHDRSCADEAQGDWHVTQCQCGELLLEFGAVCLRLSHGEFARLHRLTTAAMTRFHIEPSAAAVMSAGRSDVH